MIISLHLLISALRFTDLLHPPTLLNILPNAMDLNIQDPHKNQALIPICLRPLQVHDQFRDFEPCEIQLKATRHEETKAATLTVGYVVSQGAILISISNRSALQCYDWFVPFSLSLLLGIVYFVTFWEAVNRWYNLQYRLDLNYLDAEAVLLRIHRPPPPELPDQPPLEAETEAVRLMRRKSFMGILIVALLGFQGVMLYACRSFLCHGL